MISRRRRKKNRVHADDKREKKEEVLFIWTDLLAVVCRSD